MIEVLESSVAVFQLKPHYFARMYIQDAVFYPRMTTAFKLRLARIYLVKHSLDKEIVLFELIRSIYGIRISVILRYFARIG